MAALLMRHFAGRRGKSTRGDALGKVQVPGGPGTNSALCLATVQDPCVPLVLGDLHPQGWHYGVQVTLAQ